MTRPGAMVTVEEAGLRSYSAWCRGVGKLTMVTVEQSVGSRIEAEVTDWGQLELVALMVKNQGAGREGRRRRVELGEHALEPVGEVGGVIVEGVGGEVGEESIVLSGAAQGHLELLELLGDVGHIRVQTLYPSSKPCTRRRPLPRPAPLPPFRLQRLPSPFHSLPLTLTLALALFLLFRMDPLRLH